MTFPIKVLSSIPRATGTVTRQFTLNNALTILLGPNGSGKTQMLRGLKTALPDHSAGKIVRFVSAGRIGFLEQFRSDYDGHRVTPRYDDASFGSKGDAERRHKMETLSGDFQTLAQRADILVKIQERLRKLFKRDLLIEWDAGELKILFSRLGGQGTPDSSGREASGLLHLVGVLTALYDDEVGVLLLDEPEVSLHPQLQAFLLKEILSVAGLPAKGTNKKIVVIATHSTEMVQVSRPGDLLSLVFCYDINADPVQIEAGAGELNSKKISGLIARLGQEHKLALFAERPLLIEGPSDVLVCTALANKLDLHLEASGSQLLPVIGKDQMPIVTKLFRMLGKAPVALADADGVADGTDLITQFLVDRPDADAKAVKLGFASAVKMAHTIYSDFCALVQTRWLEVSNDAEKHAYWVSRKAGEDELAKRRAAFCILFLRLDAELAKFGADNAWENIKNRIAALLEVLESSGLFVLRRGSIEAYYGSADALTSAGKPMAAADEMEYIEKLDTAAVEAGYGDIIRCLRFASHGEPINEAEALRDLLLAVAAPAQARLKATGPEQDFNVLARSLLGDRSKIFDIAAQDDSLVISIASKILAVSGFPLRLARDADAVKVVSSALKGTGEADRSSQS